MAGKTKAELQEMNRKILKEAVKDGSMPDATAAAIRRLDEMQDQLNDWLPPKDDQAESVIQVNQDGVGELQMDYEPFGKQLAFHEDPARFRTITAGRRGGKTKSGAWETVSEGLKHSDEKGLVVSPTYGMLIEAKEAVDAFLEPFAEELIVDSNKAERWIVLISGTKIVFKSAEWPDTLRGPGYKFIWIDEAAYLKEEAVRILRGCVADKLGRIWTTSTPKGKNWTYTWHMYGLDSDYPDYSSHHWESRENPHFPESEWESIKKVSPQDWFDQEYRALFLDDVAGVFRGVDKIVRKGEAEKVAGPFSLGVDFAKKEDWTVIHILSACGKTVYWERFQKMPWPDIKARVIAAGRKFKAVIVADSTGVGDPIVDDLIAEFGEDRVHGIPFSGSSKPNLIRSLQSAIEGEEIEIPYEEQIINELKWYEYHMRPNGGVSYSAPRGFNDDCVCALALAEWGRRHFLTVIEATVVYLDEVDPAARANRVKDEILSRDVGIAFTSYDALSQRSAALGRKDFSGLN